MMMFGFSALYHKFDWNKLTKKRMRKLDHIGIFMMIAGTATPLALLMTPWPDGLILLILIWCVALLGALQVIYFPNINKFLNVAVYIGMSLILLPYLLRMFDMFTAANSILMILGIFLYIIGAVGFGLQYPKLAPKIFGYHEVWHSFVSVATILHFIVLYSII
jgi:hemolysin III